MLRDHLLAGHRYSFWANRRHADALLAADASGALPGGALRLFSHVARAEAIWIGRVTRSADARTAVWEVDSVAEALARSERATVAWIDYLSTCPDDALVASVSYQNTRGTPFTTPLADISAHVVSHGAYHRGQIAALLRAADHTPPPTDRIYYARLPESER